MREKMGGGEYGGEGDERKETEEGKGTGNRGNREGREERRGRVGRVGGRSNGREKRVGVSATTDPMDTACNNAVIGHCCVNLFKPPAPLQFRLYNK